MKNEFKRFNIEKLGWITILLEFLGATGLLIGLVVNQILIVSSLGLSLLMLCGIIFRMKFKDGIWISLPAFFFLILNAYIFYESVK